MARKNHSEEFRRQAGDLYESTQGATVRGIAQDLGIERGTLRHWLASAGFSPKALRVTRLAELVNTTDPQARRRRLRATTRRRHRLPGRLRRDTRLDPPR